ncbi:MAG: site-specific DNA-methyltransferase [Flavobacteriales bacterium]|nr:site-specific DNA-methyltransferase [Flavobacteriales bacterium]
MDLIYLDPPFFSNRNYEVIWGDEGEVRSFKDRWSGGMDHYIGWLKERVEEMHRILKPTGSIFLHCDWHADAYIRVDIMDRLFGAKHLKNHIIWKRADTVKGNVGQGKMSLDYNTDSIFYYTKGDKAAYNQPFKPYTEEYLTQFYKFVEPDGRRYRLISMIGPGGAAKGNPSYEILGVTRFWRYSQKTMNQLLADGLVVQTSPGAVPQRKQYLDDGKGVAVQNLWDDISALGGSSNEAIGYPTQKPEALMDRIIRMASNEGDVVLDPFVGGGTTVAVADKLQRKWIGIDQSVQAVKVTQYRLDNQRDLMSGDFTVQLHKYDYDTLRNKDAFEFESWIIGQFGGTANAKKGGDLGLDGKHHDGAPIQVKRSDAIGRNVIDNLFSALQRFDKKLYEKKKAAAAPAAYLIAFSFSKGAVEEVARLKSKEGCIIRLVAVEDIVPIAKKPTVKLEISELGRDKKGVRELKLRAEGVSEAGIEFFSWDWDYNEALGFKPEVLLDRIGTQEKTFKPGLHTIAVMAIDAAGLEGLEVVKLKVNGSVERS